MLGSRYSAPAVVSYVNVVGAAGVEVDVVIVLDDVDTWLEEDEDEVVEVELTLDVGVDELVEVVEVEVDEIELVVGVVV